MTDPEELLEIYDAVGRPTGVPKARGPVHRDGDWHLAFTCWIARLGEEGPELVLQRRSALKDVWPGHFDTSAAGHYRFGETLAEAVREVEEELGLTVDPAELVSLPRYRQEDRHANGVVDREHHDLYLWRCDLPLDAYRPGASEVTGIAAVPALALADLADGLRDLIDTEMVRFDGDEPRREPLRLRRERLVRRGPGYHRSIATAALALFR